MLLLNFLVRRSQHTQKNLEYGNEVFPTYVASLSSLILLLPFASKHSFYCAIKGTHCVHVASSVA